MDAGLIARGKSKGRALVAFANHMARVACAVLCDKRPYEARDTEQLQKEEKIVQEALAPRPNTR